MPLSTGTTLGPYQVIDSLGAGGMGEVYRARDTKLEREVAIKVLPDAFAADADRMARFEREAKLLAGLNHPNIATLHGLEAIDGTHFLVMELVPGESLAERLARGALSLEETLAIARQVADALEAAHEKGVIHRDLKPGNIQIAPDDIVKVLDFGLAKAMSDESSDIDTSHSPTMTRNATQAGVILGTAAYMSPEQARGKPVDRRSDIFAFGCVLFEMLTGNKAFDGETVSDILASVLKTEPDWSALPPATPPVLEKLLRRCLAKDLKQRLRDFGDAGLELRDAPDAGDVPDSADGDVTATKPRLWSFAIVGLVAFAAAWAVARFSGEAPPRDVKRVSVLIPSDFNLPVYRGTLLAMSPDGKELLLTAGQGDETQIFRRVLDGSEWAAVPGTIGGRNATFSPDGDSFAYRRGDEIFLSGAAGEVGISIADAWSDNPYWAEDGYLYQTDTPSRRISRVFPERGDLEILFEPEDDDPLQIRRVQKLPGRRAFLTTEWTSGGDASNAMLVDLDTAQHRVLIEEANFPRYVPTGHIVFTRDYDIYAVAFDLDTLSISGSPRRVIQNVRVEGGGAAQFSISDEGTLAYLPDRLYASAQITRVDREGQRSLVSERLGAFHLPALSPDGNRLAFSMDSEGRDVWVLDLERDAFTRMTFEGFVSQAVWSPDGEQLAVYGASPRAIALIAPASGPEQLARFPLERLTVMGSWLPDASGLVVWSDDGIQQLQFEEPDVLKPLITPTDHDVANPTLSPNGKFLAYGSNESGSWEIYATRFPELSQRWQISTNGGREPCWSRDGTELYYRLQDQMMAVRVDTTTGDLDPSRPEVLFEGAFATELLNSTNYDVTPDGDFILLTTAKSDEAPRVELVLNWFEELKALVPPPP